MEEEKDLVWLPKSLAKKVQALENSDSFVEKYIEESERDIKIAFDGLDDEIITYKARMVKFKRLLDEAYTEALDSNYKRWEKYDEERKLVSDSVSEVAKTLEPLTKQVEAINAQLDKISSWKIRDFIELMNQLNVALSGENRNIVEFLLNNYKTEK